MFDHPVMYTRERATGMKMSFLIRPFSFWHNLLEGPSLSLSLFTHPPFVRLRPGQFPVSERTNTQPVNWRWFVTAREKSKNLKVRPDCCSKTGISYSLLHNTKTHTNWLQWGEEEERNDYSIGGNVKWVFGG